jgi:glycosyltransferase involved in cell wall biosynthesis
MPIRNEADFIAQSLGAVLTQTYPPECMEVLIADGISDDGTREVIQQIQAKYPDVLVSVLDNPGRIVPTGFNIALSHARGDIVVRVDGHTIIAPDYVMECVDALSRSGADNVGGRMAAISPTKLGQAIALATSSPFGVGGARFHYSNQEEWVDTVYMGAWKRDVFERIGAFDEELVRNQDDEFNYRLRANGGKILLSNKIQSQYHNRSTIHSLWRQYFQYGYWKVRVMQKHPHQMRPRQFMPPLFVLALLGGIVLAPFGKLFRGLWFFVLIGYGLANLTVSLYTARKVSWHHFPRLPLVFATLHMSYGLGFLIGLLKFFNRWGDTGEHEFDPPTVKR